ncbi:MAG: diguanylate cyclase domain-containing protein [Elainella sp.]
MTHGAYGLPSYGRPTYSTDILMQAERQAALTVLGQQALSGADLPALFQTAVGLVRQVLQLPYSQVWQTLSDGHTLQAVASIGWESANTFKLQELFELLPTGELVAVNQFSWHSQLQAQEPSHPAWLPTDCVSSIRVLIPGQTKPLGLLCAYATEPHDFTADDIHFLQVVTHVLATAIERKRSEALLQTQTHILESIAAGSELQSVFEELCLLIEQQSPGALCSLLLLDRDAGRMRAGAAPSFSQEVSEALDGLMIGEGTGSCGTAAYRGEAVFVSDVATDPVWASCRDFALQHNIYACWSLPFCSQSGEVLGTFALSHAIPCEPTAYHLEMMRTATHLASIAVEGYRAAEQLKQQARYDALTGLPNRTLFLEKLQNLFRLPMQQRSRFAVLFLDVDQFKLINDSLGHTVGDQLLVELARRLQSCLGPNETFARLGGDEFAILLELEAAGDALALAHRLQTALATPLKLQDHEIFASVSIGIAHVANHYGYAEELLRDADTAMYRAKSLGRERSVIFEHTMHTQTVARLQLEIDLRRAVEELLMQRSQFQLCYQPIVSIPTQKIVGFEALVRWRHPERGLVSPLEFIPIAEETGLIGPIGHWVLQEACQQLRQWHQRFGTDHLTMNVNVSSCQFLQPNLSVAQKVSHWFYQCDLTSFERSRSSGAQVK